MALHNPFTHIEIARFFLKSGRDFEKLEIALEEGRKYKKGANRS